MDTEKAKEIVGKVTDYLNTFSSESKSKDFCSMMMTEHRTLQQNFTSLCLMWIEQMGNEEVEFHQKYIDGRNEASHKACCEISKFMKEKNIGHKLPCI